MERQVKMLKPDFKKEYIQYFTKKKKRCGTHHFNSISQEENVFGKKIKTCSLQAIRSLLNKEAFQCLYCSLLPHFGNARSVPEAPSFGLSWKRVTGISELVHSLNKSYFVIVESFNHHGHPMHAGTTTAGIAMCRFYGRYGLRIYSTKRSLKQAT